jgi:HSP20 family protein
MARLVRRWSGEGSDQTGRAETPDERRIAMRALTTKRWGTDVSPWHELETMGDRMRRWADYPAFGASLFKAPLFSETDWLPAVELVEEDGEFVLTAELPGLSKDDVHLSIDDNVLTLKGEKKTERDEAHNRMHLRERAYGTFERCFTLPRNVEAGKIRAEFHDGLVEVHMPKGAAAMSRHIEIK